MLNVYLSFAFSMLRDPVSETDDPSIYLCDTSIDGDVCNEKCMAIYVTHSDPPTRPSTFYPVANTKWTFTEINNLNYLGVSSSDVPNISGKFSDVFIPSKSGTYEFRADFAHDISGGVCHFGHKYWCSGFIEANLSYSGTGQVMIRIVSSVRHESVTTYGLNVTDSTYLEVLLLWLMKSILSLLVYVTTGLFHKHRIFR